MILYAALVQSLGWAEMSCQNLVAYWRSKHNNGRPPSRADIDPPVDITRLLPNLVLIDVLSDGFRMRLIGSEIVNRFGRDSTGRILTPDMNADPRMEEFIGCLQEVIKLCAPVYFTAHRSANGALGAVGVLLPLTNLTGLVEQIFGGIFFDGHQSITESPAERLEISLNEHTHNSK